MTEASVSRVARGSQLEPMVGPPNPGSFKVMGLCWMDGVYRHVLFQRHYLVFQAIGFEES